MTLPDPPNGQEIQIEGPQEAQAEKVVHLNDVRLVRCIELMDDALLAAGAGLMEEAIVIFRTVDGDVEVWTSIDDSLVVRGLIMSGAVAV